VKRVRAILLTVSGFALVVLAAGWVRSYFVGDEVRFVSAGEGTTGSAWALVHGGGDLVIVHWITARFAPTPSYGRGATTPIRHNMPERVVGVFGYGVCRYHPPDALDLLKYDALILPYWLFVVIAAIPWLMFASRYWRDRAARRIAAGLCPACAYDLRGGHDRCPECGADAPTRTSPA
jgi:hypothetical protein